MMTKKILGSLLIIALAVIICPLISFGQDSAPENTLTMVVSPENPEPLQNIRATLRSYFYDLDRSEITWSIDGVIKKTEIGLKTFNAQAGKNGEKTIIKATVSTPSDGVQEISAILTPSVVDLIYEPLSYTPPFYKGRSLNPNQGVVTVTAIPELIGSTGEKIPAQNIIYSWKRDGKVQQVASGIGKNTFRVAGSVPIRDIEVQVTASSLEGDVLATKQITIPNTNPKIIFYENSPIYGLMFNRAITQPVNMQTDEFSVLAMPYFFSVGYPMTPDLDYAWTLNGQTTTTQEPKNSFTVRLDKPGSGLANIGLKISNNVRIFQFADNKYNINFTKQ